MTNKPMLSVEREQILAVCNVVAVADKLEKEAFAKGVSHVDVAAFRSLRYALDHLTSVSAVELRALLDAPAKAYVLINGMHFSHAEILEWREKACADMEKAAQHQGEPVAWVECSPAWLKAGGECATAPRICVGREGISHLHPAHSNAEQPAPVAVADFYEAFRFSEIVTDDQAGELAEIAVRLNGVKP